MKLGKCDQIEARFKISPLLLKWVQCEQNTAIRLFTD